MSTPRELIAAVRMALPSLMSIEVKVLTETTFVVIVDPYNKAIHECVKPAVWSNAPDGMVGTIRGKFKIILDPNTMGRTIKVVWKDEE